MYVCFNVQNENANRPYTSACQFNDLRRPDRRTPMKVCFIYDIAQSLIVSSFVLRFLLANLMTLCPHYGVNILPRTLLMQGTFFSVREGNMHVYTESQTCDIT